MTTRRSQRPTLSLVGRRGMTQVARMGTVLALAALTSVAARADDDERRSTRVPPLPLYQQECAACHVAYPVGMLPAASWQRLMGNLSKHFGTDASLGAAEQKTLTDWLVAHAGTGRRSSATPPPEDRITRSSWFVREHDEVSAAAWKRPSIKSASNCAACHTRAEEGSFREREIRIPK